MMLLKGKGKAFHFKIGKWTFLFCLMRETPEPPLKFEIEDLEKTGWAGMTVKEMLWDIKKQMENLDIRETVLQKNVAILSEQITGLIFQKKEKREEKKVSLAIKAVIISASALLASVILGILQLVFK